MEQDSSTGRLINPYTELEMHVQTADTASEMDHVGCC